MKSLTTKTIQMIKNYNIVQRNQQNPNSSNQLFERDISLFDPCSMVPTRNGSARFMQLVIDGVFGESSLRNCWFRQSGPRRAWREARSFLVLAHLALPYNITDDRKDLSVSIYLEASLVFLTYRCRGHRETPAT